MNKRWYRALISLAIAAAIFSISAPRTTLAQSRQVKDDMAQLAVDLRAAMDRSTLTDQQKTQLRDDFKELRRARQNHERFAAMRAERQIRATLDSGAFRPDDRQRIKEDIQAIRKARGEESGGPAMGEGRFRRFNP